MKKKVVSLVIVFLLIVSVTAQTEVFEKECGFFCKLENWLSGGQALAGKAIPSDLKETFTAKNSKNEDVVFRYEPGLVYIKDRGDFYVYRSPNRNVIFVSVSGDQVFPRAIQAGLNTEMYIVKSSKSDLFASSATPSLAAPAEVSSTPPALTEITLAETRARSNAEARFEAIDTEKIDVLDDEDRVRNDLLDAHKSITRARNDAARRADTVAADYVVKELNDKFSDKLSRNKALADIHAQIETLKHRRSVGGENCFLLIFRCDQDLTTLAQDSNTNIVERTAAKLILQEREKHAKVNSYSVKLAREEKALTELRTAAFQRARDGVNNGNIKTGLASKAEVTNLLSDETFTQIPIANLRTYSEDSSDTVRQIAAKIVLEQLSAQDLVEKVVKTAAAAAPPAPSPTASAEVPATVANIPVNNDGNLQDDAGNIFDIITGVLIQSIEPGKLSDDQFSAVGNKILYRSQDKANEFYKNIEEKGYYFDPKSGATVYRFKDGSLEVHYIGGKVLQLTDPKAAKFLEVVNPIDQVNRELFLSKDAIGTPKVFQGEEIINGLSQRGVYANNFGDVYELKSDGTIIVKDPVFSEGDSNGFDYDDYINENSFLNGKLDKTVGSTYIDPNTGYTYVVAESNGKPWIFRVHSFRVSHYPPNIGQRISGEPDPNVVGYFKDEKVDKIVIATNFRFVKDDLIGHWEYLIPEDDSWKTLDRSSPSSFELFERHPEVVIYRLPDSDEFEYRQLKSGNWERRAKNSNIWQQHDDFTNQLKLLKDLGDLIVLQGLVIKKAPVTTKSVTQQILNQKLLREDYGSITAQAEVSNQEGDEAFDKYLNAETKDEKEKYLAEARGHWQNARNAEKTAANLLRKGDIIRPAKAGVLSEGEFDSLSLIKEDLQTFARGGKSAEVAALELELDIAEKAGETNKAAELKKGIEKAKNSQDEATHSDAFKRAQALSNRIKNQLGSSVITQLRLTQGFDAEAAALRSEHNAASGDKNKQKEIGKRLAELDQKQAADIAKLKAELDLNCKNNKICLNERQARGLLKESDETEDYAQKVEDQGDWWEFLGSTGYRVFVTGDHDFGNIVSGVSGLISKVGSYQPLSNLLIPDITKDWQKNANSEFIQRFAKYDAFMAESICLDDNELRSEQPGQTAVFVQTQSGTYQHVAALFAERSGDEEKLFVACTRDEQDEALRCREGVGNEEDQICKENGFCYNNRDAEEPVKGWFYKISWGVTAPADDGFTPYVDEAGNAMKFNIGVRKRDKKTFTWLYESDEAFGKNVIVLANGEGDQDTLAFYSDVDYEDVCIAIQDGYRPISYHSGAGALSPFKEFKPVEDLCRSFKKLAHKEVDFLNSNKITTSKSPSKGNVRRSRQI